MDWFRSASPRNVIRADAPMWPCAALAKANVGALITAMGFPNDCDSQTTRPPSASHLSWLHP